MTLKNSDIESQLLAITKSFLHELQSERALQAITIDASLERNLGIDSLGKVELFHRIEKHFSVHLSESAMASADCLKDIVPQIMQQEPMVITQFQQQLDLPVHADISQDLAKAKTLLDVLSLYAKKEPKRAHLYLQNEKGEEQIIRYGQLFDEAVYVARGIQKLGIKPGETIAIMLPTSEEFFYAYSGILLAGAVPIPIYPPFRPDRIEEYAKREAKILKNAEARLLITFSQAETLSKILRSFIPSLKSVMTVKALQLSEGILHEPVVTPNDTALIQYTSGSTGDPKGVQLTHANMLANMRGIGAALPIKPTDIVVSWLPLYHDMGLMNWLASLYFGMPVTILSPLTFLSRPERWLWAIHYHRGTLSGGPNFAYELCCKKINPAEIEGLDLSSWRYAFSGAEAINPRTLEHFAKKFARYGFKSESFAPVYGLAESTVALAFPTKTREPLIDKIQRDIFEKEGKAIPTIDNKDYLEFIACGEPMANHFIRIVDDNDNVLEDRRVGNLQFKGPSSMQGYFNNPAATQKIYHNGWWDSGDLAYCVDNEVFITGRKKDLIIKAGRNLYPEEVEDIVNQVAGVRKGTVIAFGIHDANTGTEKLVVVTETYETDKTKQHTIRANITEQMAVALDMPPDVVVFVPPRTVPKTSSGKLQRSACKQMYLDGKLFKQPLPAKLQILKLALSSATRKIFHWLSYPFKWLYMIYIGLILLIITPLISLCVLTLPRRAASVIIKFSARQFFRLIFCPVSLHGKANLENLSPMIFVSNHASYVDAIILIGILPAGVLFTAKKEFGKIPVLRTLLKKLGYLSIDRMDFVKSLENKKMIENLIEDGNSVVIFPEGTFTYATGLRPFKLGAFTVAVDTGTAICPVTLKGTRAILRGDQFFAKPGRITITAGKPVYPNEKSWDEMTRLHGLIRAEIAKHCGEPAIDVITAGPAAWDSE